MRKDKTSEMEQRCKGLEKKSCKSGQEMATDIGVLE